MGAGHMSRQTSDISALYQQIREGELSMEDARDRLRHLRAHGPALNLRHGDPAIRDQLIHGNQ